MSYFHIRTSVLALLIAAVSQASVTYNAVSDRAVRPLPPLPRMGAAGSVIVDPTFGTRILRVTDANTDPSREGFYVTTSGGFVQAWSQDSTRFFARIPGGAYGAFELNPSTMQTRYLGAIPLAGPCWGGYDRSVVYGMASRAITAYNVDAGTSQVVLDLDSVVPGFRQSHYALSCTPDGNVFAVSFGGMQDTYQYLVHYDRRTGRKQLVNLVSNTVNGRPLPIPVKPRAGIHSQDIDKTGRYVSFIGPGLPGMNAIFWDTQSGAMMPQSTRSSGHAALGYGTQVNQSGLLEPSDSRGFILRYLDNPNGSLRELTAVSPPGPHGWTYGGHWSWNNARPDMLTPLVGSFYKEGNRAWGLYDGEIVAVRTDGADSTIWRIAHHRSVTDDSNFGWDQPHGNVSPDGRWFIFTSNWGKSLGTTSDGSVRRDVFVVQMPLAEDGYKPPYQPPPTVVAPGQNPAPSAPPPVPVGPFATETTLQSDFNPTVAGQKARLVVRVSPSSSGGQATVKRGGTVIGTAPVKSGTAVVDVDLPQGVHRFTASYSGDGSHYPSVSKTQVHVVFRESGEVADGASGWNVVATADLDRDGVPDVILQSEATRQVIVWYLGASPAMFRRGMQWLSTTKRPGWRIAGAGDMNGDHAPDLVWQYEPTGQLAVWYLGGSLGMTIVGSANISHAPIDPAWRARAAVDLDRNGKPDVVLQHETTGQAMALYFGGSGATVTGSGMLGDSTGLPGWEVSAARDLDGNGVPDLVLHSASTGRNTIWFLGGERGEKLVESLPLILPTAAWKAAL